MISTNTKGADILRKLEDFDAEERIGGKLLENSIHFLTGEIGEENISECIRWIVYENLDDSNEKILTIYINSTGGDLYPTFALIDIMRNSKHPIRTIGIGSVMSAAFLIFAAGTKGQRYAALNTSFMCHQHSEEGSDSKYHDLKAAMKETDAINKRMLNILKDSTDLPVAKIKSKLLPASDVYLTAEETIELTVADYLL